MRRLLTLIGAVFLAVAGTTERTDALEISAGVPGLCLATISGPIRNGDLAKLKTLSFEIPADWQNLEDGRWKSLCLNSPGGSYTEGFRIAAYFLDNAIGTVVNENAQCLSACSLIFMFGTAYQSESNSLTHRRLHIKGTLGFHQPELPLDPSIEYSIEDVRAAFSVAIEATLRFLALAARPRPDNRRPFVDSDLQEAMLSHKGQDFYLIDTVNKAGRWDIELIGLAKPRFDERAFFNACQNMLTWPARLAGAQRAFGNNGFDYSLGKSRWTAGGLTRDRFDLQFAQMQTYDCAGIVAQHWTGETLAMLCGFREDLNASAGPDDCRAPEQLYSWSAIPAQAMFPAATPLKELASAAVITPDNSPAPLRNLCVSETGRATVINVQNFTSLRQGTSHETAKLDELPQGSSYAVPRLPTLNVDYDRHATCSKLCQAAAAQQLYDQAALGQCIDENWMWFELTGPSGRRGYASAKFLDY